MSIENLQLKYLQKDIFYNYFKIIFMYELVLLVS